MSNVEEYISYHFGKWKIQKEKERNEDVTEHS